VTEDPANVPADALSPDAEATSAETGTWTAAGCIVVGSLLVALALVPGILFGPSNPYAAAGLVVFGFLAIALACAVEAYGIARRFVPASAAVLAAVGAGIVPLLPLGLPGVDEGIVVVWMSVLAIATVAVHRSRAAWVLAAVTALPVLGLVALVLAK
jgi:hypothetical protein